MDVQAAPPPYTPVGGSNMASGNPPVLGSQVPGSTGGLPALSGLSTAKNPMAEQLQSMGRGDDTMLVHMTPNEVNSLQGLAMAAGGSLTLNPQTGLPEAGFLSKILPTLLGVGLSFIPGVGPLMAAGIVGAGQTALTGDLSKGLMAGLGAFGGASLAGAAGLGAAGGAAKAGAGAAGGTGAGATTGAATGATATIPGAVPGMVGTQVPASMLTDIGGQAINLTSGAAKTLATTAAKAPGTGFLSKFSSAAQQGLPSGILQKAAPYAAGAGLLNTISEATAPQMPKYNSEEDDYEYVPMGPGVREVRFQTPEQMRASGGAEFPYFTPTNPAPMPLVEQPRRFAEGGLAAVPPQGFEDLVSFFDATNPGAITASMYPTSPTTTTTPGTAAPASGGEVVHNFARPARNATANSLGIGDGMNPYGTFGIANFNGFDINDVLNNRGYAPVSRSNQPTTPTMMSQRESESMPIRGGGGSYRGVIAPRMEAYASGGAVDMRDGSFVVDARTVSELGNGSSNAGIEMLSRMGGRPVRGPGDGVSDSVRASIGGKQEARVARDEVIFSPEAVRRLGGGSESKGTKKLYALMDMAHKARKKAKRGQDTKVRKGLA